jgi:hypothetical protein
VVTRDGKVRLFAISSLLDQILSVCVPALASKIKARPLRLLLYAAVRELLAALMCLMDWIGLFIATGAGKSSILNAILDGKGSLCNG